MLIFFAAFQVFFVNKLQTARRKSVQDDWLLCLWSLWVFESCKTFRNTFERMRKVVKYGFFKFFEAFSHTTSDYFS